MAFERLADGGASRVAFLRDTRENDFSIFLIPLLHLIPDQYNPNTNQY